MLHELPESLGPRCLAGETLQVLLWDVPFLQEVVDSHLGIVPPVQAVLLVGQGDVPKLQAMESRSLHSLDNWETFMVEFNFVTGLPIGDYILGLYICFFEIYV